MHKIISVQTRPNTSVDFWGKDNPALTEEYSNYYRNNYIVTGKVINMSAEVSPNGLVLTTTMIWDSESSINEWRNDPVVQENFTVHMKAYQTANNITVERSEEAI